MLHFISPVFKAFQAFVDVAAENILNFLEFFILVHEIHDFYKFFFAVFLNEQAKNPYSVCLFIEGVKAFVTVVKLITFVAAVYALLFAAGCIRAHAVR